MPFKPVAFFAAVALLMLAAAACGGDDSGPDTNPTPGITVVSQSSQVASLVTPFPTPILSDNAIDSSNSKGYSATFPAGWTFYPNRIQTRDASVDVIFEPLIPGAKAQASIAINCVVQKAESAEEHVIAESTKVARIGTNRDIRESERQIAGRTAKVISYVFSSPNEDNIPPLDKQDVIFSNDRCDWIITTVTPEGQRPTYQPQFDAFLASFQLAD